MDACLMNERLLCTMLLDHRYAYVDKWIFPVTWTEVESWISFYDKKTDSSNCSSTSTSVDLAEDIDDFLESSLIADPNTPEDIKSELIRYRAFITTSRPSYNDPLDFWRGNKIHFERLSIIAKELFSIPASASVCERCFSRCSDLINQKKRNRIKPETLNSILTVAELAKLERAPDVNILDGSDDTDDSSSSDTTIHI
uniref:Dimer_Tnp_hAT domain-containing protein n=1 Tax=Caenorhabditis japonica TaxID=281687 RepID=A0A8R1DVG9_CAEJA